MIIVFVVIFSLVNANALAFAFAAFGVWLSNPNPLKSHFVTILYHSRIYTLHAYVFEFPFFFCVIPLCFSVLMIHFGQPKRVCEYKSKFIHELVTAIRFASSY